MISKEDSETSDLKICSSLPIPELIKRIRYSSSESEFDKVREILIDRENSMKSKLDNLLHERDSWKEKERLLERALISSGLEKCKFEEKWQQSQRECEELNERIKELIENQKLTSNRERGGDGWHMKACEETIEMARSENMESGRTVGEDKEKRKAKFVQMFKEMKGLRREKEAADQTVKELRGRESEANQIIDELKRQNTEATRTMDELRLKKSESDKAAELSKKMLESLTPRIRKVEEALATIYNVNIEDLAHLVRDSENSTDVENPKHVKLPDSEGKRESFRNATGGGNSVPTSRTKVDGADGFQTSPGAQSGNPPPQVEADDADIEHESKRLRRGSDFIYIVDSVDETPISCESLGEIEKISEKSPFANLTFHQNSSHPKRKRGSLDNMQIGQQRQKHIRKFTHVRDESLGDDFSGKLNPEFDGTTQTNIPSMNNQGGAAFDSHIILPNFFDLPSNHEESTDSEESCPESQQCKTWMYAVEMLEDFKNDVELCMNAVCVLYRRQHRNNTSSESVVDSSEGQQNTSSESASVSSGGLSHFNAMGGRALAEYLINGDPEQRLRKSVNEVKDQYPEALELCRQLAKDYYAMLFYIYCTEEDPFFKSG